MEYRGRLVACTVTRSGPRLNSCSLSCDKAAEKQTFSATPIDADCSTRLLGGPVRQMIANMAMQAVTDVSKDRGHGKTGSTSSARSIPMPASPTLTNPDMILPDWDPGAVSSPDRSQSPLNMWKTANGFDMSQFDLGAPAFPAAPITPTTPIIYGNGTMLSDIGEVTENESTVGGPGARRASSIYSLQQPETMQLVYETLKKKHSDQTIVSQDRERRFSMESTSTITNGDNPRLFADFDDTVSVDDSVFQGDDEESNAVSYAYDETSMTGDETPTTEEFSPAFTPAPEDRYSTVLSRRAEQILANAKRRLTVSSGAFSACIYMFAPRAVANYQSNRRWKEISTVLERLCRRMGQTPRLRQAFRDLPPLCPTTRTLARRRTPAGTAVYQARTTFRLRPDHPRCSHLEHLARWARLVVIGAP